MYLMTIKITCSYFHVYVNENISGIRDDLFITKRQINSSHHSVHRWNKFKMNTLKRKSVFVKIMYSKPTRSHDIIY